MFEPGLRYRIAAPPAAPLESEDFLRMLGALANSTIHRNTRIEVLTNGEVFYEAELEAIRNAEHNAISKPTSSKGTSRSSIHRSACRQGASRVQVNLVIDAVGSLQTGANISNRLRRRAGESNGITHPLHTLLE